MNEQLIIELGALIALVKYPGAILATVVYVSSLILGSKDPSKDAKDVKEMFK